MRAFDFDSKFENLLTSARFIAKELYKEYDVIERHMSLLEFKFIISSY